MGGEETLGGASGIQFCSKLTGMDMVAMEMVFLLPGAEGIYLLTADLIQVDEGYTLDGSDIGSPLGMRLADDTTSLIVGITGCK